MLTNSVSVTRAESDAYPDNNAATNMVPVGLPALSIFDVASPEGNSGTTNALFSVTLSAPSPDAVTVTYATADDSAHAGADYIGTNGILVLPPGATNAVISVLVIGDVVVETDKDFQVTLSNPTNAVLTRAQAAGTILDGDKYSTATGHFDWAAIPSPQHTKEPFYVAVAASGPTGVRAIAFDRLITFSPSVSGVRLHPAVSGSFSNGVWTGKVTVDDPVSGLVLKADDEGGHTGLSTAFNVVRGNMPPAILSPPTGRVVTNGTATALSAVADGTPPLSYQWTLNGTNVAGATNSTLTIASAQSADAGDYAVQVSNSFGTEQSSPASMSVGAPPVITGQPANQAVVLGTSASFAVIATGTDPLSYQWSYQGTDVPEATNATLTIPSAQSGDAGNYAVRVFNLFGSEFSSNALLTVGLAPFLTAQPMDVAVAVGGNATFTVAADGTAPLAFQWTFNGTNVMDATNSTLMLANVQMTDEGEYAVQVFNAFGLDQSSNAVLTVGDPPLITGQPANQTVVLGTPASFTVTVTGTEPLNFQWAHEGIDVPDATNATLSIPSAQTINAGNYTVRIFNLFGTQTSSNALLTVGLLPVVTAQPTNLAVAVGGDATFMVTADGTAPLTFQWTFNGTNVMDATNSTLMLTNVQMTDEGEYAVQVFNAFGMDQSSNAVLTVGDPPLITGQPANQTVVLGTPASFTVIATGTGPLNFQWSHEGTDLPDATNATLSIPSAQTIDAGNYTVRIFNLFGTQTSSNALLTVGLLPVVTAQPTNLAVAVGGDATFTVAADGTAPITFQWTFNGTNLMDATNGSLMLTNVQMTDEGEYAVQVFNAFGMDQSSNAVLTVGDPPLITDQPANQTVVLGTPASFTVTVTGTEPLNFQWAHEGIDVPDATNATLSIPSAQTIDAGNYTVRIFNLFGTQTSSNALLTVGLLPVVTMQPTNFAVAVGGDATFSVTADGTAPLAFQWTFNGTNVMDATNSTLMLTNVQMTDAGEYAVQVYNAFGMDQSSNAVLTVGDPPLITGQPANQTVVLGTPASFTVAASGTEPLNFQWAHEGIDVPDATNATLSIPSAQTIDAGNYTVRTFNLFGTQTSSNALLTVGLLPVVTAQPTNVVVAVGGDATFTVTADGTAPLAFRWTFNGTNVMDATNSTLMLTNVQMTDEGEYAVQVFNAFGMDQSSNAVLTVGDPPLITGQPANQTVVLGTPASFTVIATGTGPLNFQWSHEGTDLPDATNATLSIPSAQTIDAGNYTVRIFNLFGTQTSSNALLTVGLLPVVTAQPTNLAVAVGGDATFTVAADGTAPITFQWTFNGTNVMDATNSTLMLTNVQITDAGEYAVQVFNAFGLDQSSNAVLTVGDLPLITGQPANQTVVLGTPASFTVIATGTEPLNFQWAHEGIDVPDATNATLSIPSAQTINAGNYTVRIFNLFGTQTSSNALLTVGLLPVVTLQPTNFAVAVGGDATFTVTAEGTAPLTFQWTVNGTNVMDATNSTLMLTNVQMTDAGEYVVQVFNAFGLDQSSNAVLTVGDLPLITSQPENQTVVLGTSASFTVIATGTEPLNFQWAHEGIDVPDATNATLSIPSAQTIDAGNYTVRIFNLFGTQTSSNALLTVGLLPVVTAQPTNLAVAVGGDATFMVTADGTAPLTFQWTFNGTNVMDATNSTLMLTNVQMTDEGEYAVQVYNAFGMDQSSNAVLTVGDLPLITSQPANQTVVLGTSASFTVIATGTEPLNFQWAHEGIDLPDATNATLSIPSAQTMDAGNYTVRVFNRFGTQTSSNALLTVGLLPVVTAQPTNVSVVAGGDATFTVLADGSAPFGYQWSINGTNIIDATNSTLVLTNVQLSESGLLAVQVFNQFGADHSSNAVLEVLPVCTPAPSGIVGWWGADGSAADSITGMAGSMTHVSFAPGKVGSAFLFDGTNGAVNLGDPASLIFTNSFSIEAWIWINQLPSAEQGQAQILFRGQSDPCLDPYFLSVAADGTLRFHIADGSRAPCGVDAYSSVVATGQWVHVAAVFDATNEMMSILLDGELSAQLNTAIRPFANLQDGGVVIGNRISQDGTGEPFDGLIDELAVYDRVLSVDEIGAIHNSAFAGKCPLPPSLRVQPADLAVAAGSGAVLESAAAGTPPLSFQWSLNGTNILNATNNLLTLGNVQVTDAGQYVVAVANAAGSTSSVPAMLTVVLPPVIVVQPTNQTLPAGTAALLTVTAVGTTPFHYQWRRGTTNLIDDGRILGANSSTLVITNLLPADSDSYSVTVSNLAGTVVSSNATLIVYSVDHFTWDPIPPARFVNVPFRVTIRALDASNNVVTPFSGPVWFATAAGDPVSPPQSGNFTNGVWSGCLTLTHKSPGVILIAADGFGHAGNANAFDVVDLPLMTFQQSGKSMVISWSAYGPVFTPETSSDLKNWAPASLPIDLLSSQFKIRVRIAETNTFYRLRFIGP